MKVITAKTTGQTTQSILLMLYGMKRLVLTWLNPIIGLLTHLTQNTDFIALIISHQNSHEVRSHVGCCGQIWVINEVQETPVLKINSWSCGSLIILRSDILPPIFVSQDNRRHMALRKRYPASESHSSGYYSIDKNDSSFFKRSENRYYYNRQDEELEISTNIPCMC